MTNVPSGSASRTPEAEWTTSAPCVVRFPGICWPQAMPARTAEPDGYDSVDSQKVSIPRARLHHPSRREHRKEWLTRSHLQSAQRLVPRGDTEDTGNHLPRLRVSVRPSSGSFDRRSRRRPCVPSTSRSAHEAESPSLRGMNVPPPCRARARGCRIRADERRPLIQTRRFRAGCTPSSRFLRGGRAGPVRGRAPLPRHAGAGPRAVVEVRELG